MGVRYDDVAAAVAATEMVVRGGFVVSDDDEVPDSVGGEPTRCVLVIGNVGGAMWPRFRAEQPDRPDPLDTWTRSVLQPIADAVGARYVHPGDEPFQPFQRWARRADDVWSSPIGVLVHPDHGLWHAYRGAFLFPLVVDGLPVVGRRTSPCLTCPGQPCLSTCPVAAFTPEGYDAAVCADHVRSGSEPRCLEDGCAARGACPVGADRRYGPDQMAFHMRAFVGWAIR